MASADLIRAKPITDAAFAAPLELQLQIPEILASQRRLWLRGCVRPASEANGDTIQNKSAVDAINGKLVRLQSRIGGKVASVDVELTSTGRFEALLEMDLPPTRRGWRIARTKILLQDTVLDSRSVVLHPPTKTMHAVLVVLPANAGEQYGKVTDVAAAARVGAFLRRCVRNGQPVYYLACVDSDLVNEREAVLSFALAAQEWPMGTVIGLPGPRKDAEKTLTEGINRFRWLFAGELELTVVNLDERLATYFRAELKSGDDRASFASIINSSEELAGNGFDSTKNTSDGVTRPTRSYGVTRYPLVFCHGLLPMAVLYFRTPQRTNYFANLEPFLRPRGFRALFPDVAPTAGVADRARQLRDLILNWTDEPVNVIAHSVGGLDARHMICHLNMADRVKSLTTVSCPHRGTYVADWFLQKYHRRLPYLFALEMLGQDLNGFHDCCQQACARFNETTPDAANVAYFSCGAAVPQARVHPVLRRPWAVLNAAEGPNDGVVSLVSSRWGEYLGTLPADHFIQTPDTSLQHPAASFDSCGYYLQLVAELSRRGF